MFIFNTALFKRARVKGFMKQEDFARKLGVTKSFVSATEHGIREPSLEFLRSLVKITGIPAVEWLPEETVSGVTGAASDIKNRMNRDHLEIQRREEEIWKLEATNDHLAAIIQFYEKIVDIERCNGLSKEEIEEKYRELVILTIWDGELNFREVRNITKIRRSIIRDWMDTAKQPYVCAQFEGGMIMAASPGEAALCLRCYTCVKRDGGECLGYGNEHPENIVEMFDCLDANGIYNATEISDIFKTYYKLDYPAQYIINIRYKIKNDLPIPDDVYYMDTARRTV
jgi:transcriptional regulator with XRE-family HTH domain